MSPDAPLLSRWVSGTPATFSTQKEKAWKEALSHQLPSPHLKPLAQGIVLHFGISGPPTGPLAADVDNLCEPVFSVLVNKKRWFGGSRPNVRWYRATKFYAPETGCHIDVLPFQPGGAQHNQRETLLNETFPGPLPRRATDPLLAEWAIQAAIAREEAERYSVRLRFGGMKVNIGEIATGPVKSCIDCLYPIIGGAAGKPEDWRVDELHVEKGSDGIPEGAVGIVVHALR